MGAAGSNPIDEATQKRITDRIEEVVKTFAIEFTTAFAQEVVSKAKAEKFPETDWTDALLLQEAPIPSRIVKTGILIKRGEIVKNWKPRFFVAYNEKDNFRIDYHDGSDATGKLKGSIFAAGYSAYEFDQDDVAEHGDKGIKLVPWSWRRRTWWIKVPDDKEREEWLAVFRTACYKSKPPRNEDEVIANAFDIALRNTRWKNWIWGWYSDAGSEAERLATLILDVLDRDIINEVIGGIAEGPAKSYTVDLIRKNIDIMVKSAASSTWVSASTSVEQVAKQIEEQVKTLIDPIIEKQEEFKELITEKIGGKINPFLEEKAGSLLKPIVEKIFKPIIRAFVLAATKFHAFIREKISNDDFADSSFDSTLDRVDWMVDWWSGPIHDAYAVVWRMYTDDMTQILTLLSGGVTAYTVYNMVNDKLNTILHRAVFTFGQLAKSSVKTEYNHVLNVVVGQFFHDIFFAIKATIIDVLFQIISSHLQEHVIEPSKQLIEPVQKILEEVPIPGLTTLIDLPALLEEVVNDITTNALEALLKKSLGQIKDDINVAAVEVGISSVSFEEK